MKKYQYLTLAIFLSLLASSSMAVAQEANDLFTSFSKHREMVEDSKYGLDWIQLGPVLNSARVEAIQVHPDDPNTIYAAFGSGGLWKTTNGGLTWNSIFDHKPSQGIGDIAIAPSDPDIIYLGSGENLKKPRNFTMPGTGVYRTDDGGATWVHAGLENVSHISEVVVHPEDPNIVLVAAMGKFWTRDTNRGIFRTEDGGKSWEKVLYIDNKTSGNDLVFAPSNPDIVYASVWENDPQYAMHLSPDSKGLSGKKSGVYKSTDSGKNWIRIDTGMNVDENAGRIGLGVSWSDPGKVYAFMDRRNKEEGKGAGELYLTTDGGGSWIKTHEEDIHTLSVIGWYFMDTYVNPMNDDEVYLLGVRMARSKDAGKSIELIGGTVHHHFPSIAQTLHLDHCEMWINPNDPDHLVLGNDGGVYVSRDAGENWRHFNNIPAGEFYDIALSNEKPYRIFGGTQDDATVYGPAKEWDPEFEDAWKYLFIDAWSGGDGCISAVDPNDTNTVYFSMQHAAVRRKDMAADTSISIQPRLPKKQRGSFRSNFITPYFLSEHNSNTLYLAGNYVFRSTDRGDNWTVISKDLSDSRDRERESHAAGALAESPLESGWLYMGTDRGLFWISEDDGETWKDRSEGLPIAYIRSISPSRHNKGRIYLAASGMNYDDHNNYLFISEDQGQNWMSITSNLPNEVANVIKEDPFNENILYAGTLRGVYISTDRGSSWSILGKGLPTVAVADIEIDTASRELVAATHGRGIYMIDISSLYSIPGNSKNLLFSPKPGQLPGKVDTHNDFERSTKEKVRFTWWSEASGQVDLEIVDLKDSLIWTLETKSRPGLNQYRWDLVTARTDSPLPYFVKYENYIKPGEYRLRLKIDGAILEESWVVRE